MQSLAFYAERMISLLSDPQERIFWPYLLGAVVLAFLCMGLRSGGRALLQGLFSRRIWLHPSSLGDFKIILLRAAITIIWTVPWLAWTAKASLWLGLSFVTCFGVPTLELPPAFLALSYTIALFVAWDASRFMLHYLMHHSRLLWSFHRIHHGAEVLTPLTLFRTHPVEVLLYDLRGLLVTSLVTGTFLYLFQGRAEQWEIMGINAVGFLMNSAGANLRHSQVWLRFGACERYLLSPAQHQMHHAADRALQMSNYGTYLACWDRLAGSWRAAPEQAVMRFGTGESGVALHTMRELLMRPLLDAYRQLRLRAKP